MTRTMHEIPRPNFFIVGAPKCGTTSMYEYLEPHPEVFMSPRKEPHFFATDLQWQWDWNITDEAEYLALFKNAGYAKRIGEASTWYLYSSGAAQRIKAFSPDARIIVMLRNPVDMLRSLHWHSIRNGTEDLHDFAAALEAEEDRRSGRRIPKAAPFADALLYRTVPLYAQQLSRYLQTFGREQVLVIIFDDFADNERHEYLRVTDFLRIDPAFMPEFTVANPGTARSGVPFPRFLRRHHRVHRLIQATTPAALRRRLGSILNRVSPAPPPKPPGRTEAERKLRAHFAPEIEDLSQLLDRDLTHWCRVE